MKFLVIKLTAIIAIMLLGCRESKSGNLSDKSLMNSVSKSKSEIHKLLLDYPKNGRNFSVDIAVMEGAPVLNLYMDQLNKSEMDSLHKIFQDELDHNRAFKIVYLSNAVEINGVLVERKNGTLEIVGIKDL
jgi:hypothetical protein